VQVRDVIRGRLFVSRVHAVEPTMVAWRASMVEYQETVRTGEDQVVMEHFRRVVLLDRPALFTHVVHAGSLIGVHLAEGMWRDRSRGGAL
jgi:hypothetical protein